MMIFKWTKIVATILYSAQCYVLFTQLHHPHRLRRFTRTKHEHIHIYSLGTHTVYTDMPLRGSQSNSISIPDLNTNFHGNYTSLLARCTSAKQLEDIIWHIGKTHKFDELPWTVQELLQSTFAHLEYSATHQDAGNIIWALSELDLHLTSIPGAFRSCLFSLLTRCVPCMKATDLKRTLWGLAVMDMPWDALSEQTQWDINVAIRRTGYTMSHEEIAQCAHAVSLLCFDSDSPMTASIRGVHETLLNQIVKRSKTQDPNEDSNTRKKGKHWFTSTHGHNQMLMFAHYALGANYRVPHKLLHPAQITPALPRVSALQQRVTDSLNCALVSLQAHPRSAYSVQPEYCHFGGVLPVDVAILQYGQVVALLEVDGPQHYRNNGALTRKSQFKESLYKRALPGAIFHRISFKDVQHVGVDAAVNSFLETLLEVRSGSPLQRQWRNFRLKAKALFDWVLRNSTSEESKEL